MFELPARLADACVLLSNDDGIHAPGLHTLEKCLEGVVRELWVCAPEHEQSGAGHSLTLRRPLRLRKVSEGRHAVDGTPTDSVLLGVNELMGDRRPDLVISGINRGGNLGEDVTYSGTIAAAMEGTLLGIPSVALSQVCSDTQPVKWATAEHFVPKVLERLLGLAWPRNVLMNVNFPDVVHGKVKGVEVTIQGKRKLGGEVVHGIDPRGQPYYWIGAQRQEDAYAHGTDLEAVTRGCISITPLCMDLTHRPALPTLEEAFR